MLMDRVTETIAHFIGLLDSVLEQTRLRKAYDEFKAQQSLDQEQSGIPNITIKVNSPYELKDFDPFIPYVPKAPELVKAENWMHIHVRAPEISDIPDPDFHLPRFHTPDAPTAGLHIGMPPIDPPGSLATYIDQDIRLSDNDYVGAGGHGLVFTPVSNHGAELAALVDAAKELTPLGDSEAPGSAADIVSFITSAAAELKAFAEAAGDADADIFIAKDSALQGNYVNGELVEEIPDLDDYLPKDKDEEEEAEPEPSGKDSFDPGGHAGHAGGHGSVPINSASGGHASGDGGAKFEVSVEVEAGHNTLINSAAIVNNWVNGEVIAVMGDHVELNAIIQSNVWCDSDLISSAVNGWTLAGSDPTEAFNIGVFKRTDPSAEDDGPEPGGFPRDWVVTKVEGDLIITNWIEQFGFMMDNDVHVLSSSGVKTSVITGDNTAVNESWLQELGHHYDLIIVGGNIYDANLIHQMNVLMDNDLIGAVDGFETTGQGSASTNDNLLWNYAEIQNVGGADRFEALPDHYRKAAENLQNGKNDLPDAVLHDPAFAGISGLRVLYISGDYINLNYVKQVNVLGDNDQVALAMNALHGHPEAQWTISTGSNALVNLAGIVDVDTTGKTYVGGNTYSDELLIQAEMISAKPDLLGQNPDALVNEAVAFLDDDMMAPDGGQPATHGTALVPDASYADPMQAMVS